MKNFIIIAVIVLIVALAVWSIVRQKKNGAKCIGCPSGANCKGGCCHCKEEE